MAAHLRSIPGFLRRLALLSVVVAAIPACGAPERATEPVTRVDEVSPETPPAIGTVPPGGDGWAIVSVGTSHSCALTLTGVAYCWGDNRSAQVGVASAPDICGPPAAACARRPVRVATGLRFVRLSVGGAHACALDTDGRVHCWGNNSYGQLGLVSPRIAFEPLMLQGSDRFKDVSAGEHHTCGLRLDGAILCWGRNENGELGRGSFAANAVPTVVAGVPPLSALASGSSRTCATAATGAAYCWGRIWLYTLGGLEWSRRQATPSLVPGGIALSALSVGSLSTCGIGPSGTTYCWEANGFGQLGSGGLAGTIVPSPVAGGHAFRNVSVGSIQSCGIGEDYRGYCWGNNTFGQLGDYTARTACPPSGLACAASPIPIRAALRFVSLSTGFGNHVCGVTTLTNLYCWGLGTVGQLGDGDARTVVRYEPERVAARSE